MNLYLLEDFEDDVPPDMELIGSYVYDTANSLCGDRSLRMATDPNTQQNYAWIWYHNLPLLTGSVRLEVTAAINLNIRSFGIGCRIYKNNQLAIMFARIDYANNRIELVQNTDPHIWETVATPIPLALRSNNPLRPFRLSLDMNTDTLTYERLRVHDFTKRDGGQNDFVYTLTTQNVPTSYAAANGISIKINPQGVEGIAGALWLDDVKMWN